MRKLLHSKDDSNGSLYQKGDFLLIFNCKNMFRLSIDLWNWNIDRKNEKQVNKTQTNDYTMCFAFQFKRCTD